MGLFLTLIGSRLGQYVIAFIIGFLLLIGIHFMDNYNCSVKYQNEQLIAQAKEDKKREEEYRKIDSAMPTNKPDGIKWLLRKSGCSKSLPGFDWKSILPGN